MATYIQVPETDAPYPTDARAQFPAARGDAITGDRY